MESAARSTATSVAPTPVHPAPRKVLRRDGTTAPYDADRIGTAITKAFLAVEGAAAGASDHLRPQVAELTGQVGAALLRRGGADRSPHVEEIQDQVELALMRAELHQVARAYVLYRERRSEEREKAEAQEPAVVSAAPRITVRGPEGDAPLDEERLARVVTDACQGLSDARPGPVLEEVRRNLYDGITADELALAQVMAARTLVEREPEYAYVAARLLLDKLRAEAVSELRGEPHRPDQRAMAADYPHYFASYVERGVQEGLLDEELGRFDLARLGSALKPERDLDLQFLGLQTLYDRYFQHVRGVRIELPQAFFMRVAMGLALREDDREARAVEFYELLSSFDFMCSTPTLFNSGTRRPQLSSCFLTTVQDDLEHIFLSLRDNALLSKYAGGLGNDWTPVRGMGAHIKGTNGRSQGVVPFLKIANDTAIAVNQGGKRKGAACAYLETWHIDVEEFLDLRKNTGDDRRRTHDMNTANWVPDLFLQRVEADAEWTLFSPDETPDLHDLYGKEFAARYEEYEAAADRGEIRVHKRLKAVDLWRRMLTMLFETGHPWITFKDACNLRSPQQHAGVVHSSNLCTEITLNTSRDEVAVCNLGSVNLARHVGPEGLDTERLKRTVTTAVRMLDNVIDINHYTVPQARRSNERHRPVGLGLMGYQDALFTLRIPVSSPEAVEFADRSMEQISFHAVSASVDLAAERGPYESFEGSLWSKGVLPIDSVAVLAGARDGDLEMDTGTTLEWDALRERVRTTGMRNSNVMAIAPTATIANITGVSQSIEPQFRNLFVKANMSGDFTVTNPHLVRDLKERGLWDDVMISDLKYHDGSLGALSRIPDDLKALYATAFEIDPEWLVKAASRRQKWIDQAQSLNLYLSAPSGRKLDRLYRAAWRSGCKTTYYLRAQSATHVEKSTLATTDGKLNSVPVAPASSAASPAPSPSASPSPSSSPSPVTGASAAATASVPAACSVEDPECEACQ
ncbi:ribonucleoside-diphosphate reductase subunit alpha [Streptomyces nanshensis]|uniref:ribonucleoside-diphosphate reductase subunit alpha n=1 Tax=Streptomyces nanshensis TaxID=518642 RepID=UPI0009A0642A|nr:ribonucleoside-diphosphate reductase subunit alpha [Streptomyces nanshensis]